MAEGQRNGKFSQKFGKNGKSGQSCVRVTKGRPCEAIIVLKKQSSLQNQLLKTIEYAQLL